MVIAADGRRSSIAFGLGLASHPARPRRWALGAYFEGVSGLEDRGEMHIRRGRYIGVAPVPDGLANVCVVVPELAARSFMHAPDVALEAAIVADRRLRGRFDRARRVTAVQVLGPLAVDAPSAGSRGVLLAGDAAGFIDPMTGDGLRIALQGRRARRRGGASGTSTDGFGSRTSGWAADVRWSWRTSCASNRLLRALVARPLALSVAAVGARIVPSVVERIIAYAGGCRRSLQGLQSAVRPYCGLTDRSHLPIRLRPLRQQPPYRRLEASRPCRFVVVRRRVPRRSGSAVADGPRAGAAAAPSRAICRTWPRPSQRAGIEVEPAVPLRTISLAIPNMAPRPNHSDGLMAPANPNVSGRRSSAYRLISPPIDDPMIPVATRSRLVRNSASMRGFSVSIRNDR